MNSVSLSQTANLFNDLNDIDDLNSSFNTDFSNQIDPQDAFFDKIESNNFSNYIPESNLGNFFRINSDASGSNCINLLHINCRSLKKNFDSISTLLAPLSDNLTAIALSETWLTSATEQLYTLNGYTFVSKHRTNKIGGGVGLYINNNLSFKLREDLSQMDDFIECLFIEIAQQNKSNILIGCIYRPPNSNIELFQNAISAILDKINRKKSKLAFIAGDYNLDLLKSNQHIPTGNFLNLLNSHSFLSTIKYPTRITEFSSSLIDNIFINSLKYDFNSAIVYSDVSDHLPIALHFNLTIEKNKPMINVKRRFYSSKLINNFCNDLNCISWEEVCYNAETFDNVSDTYSLFSQRFLDIFDKHFPLKTVKFSKKSSPHQEWITKGLIKSCYKKSLLYRNYISNPTPINKNLFVKYRNKLKSLLQKTKVNYYKNRFNTVAGNLRYTWKIINSVLKNNKSDNFVLNFVKDGNIVNSACEIVEHFNTYFVNIGSTLCASIQPESKQFTEFMPPSQMNSFALYYTDIEEIVSIVNKFGNKSSFGVDNVPIDVMKSCIACIAKPLCALVNCSFRTGIFPDPLKIAKVCPVFKNGSENNFSDYRPISVLPSFSKIFEKVAFNRLEKFVTSCCILSNCQYGFRQKHSTYMALLDMYNKVSESIDDNKFTIGIFIDLAKAFDTINHNILCKKLEIYGIRGIALHWFQNYLSNRKQYVCFNGASSSLKNITCGVPQGSILGPLLFILYINDIVRCSDLLKFIMFADDTNIFYSNSSIDDLEITINSELSKVCQWFRCNKLSLNANKTKYILFGKKGKSAQCFNLTIQLEDVNIERVTSTKFLGVIVDEDLNWKQHIANISLKISRSLGVLNKVKYIFSKDILKTLYFTMIQPYFIYCNIIWGGANQITINRLYYLQKRAVRIISHSPYREPTNPLFERNCILKLEDVHKIQLAMFIYKCQNNLLPMSCCCHIQFNSNPHHYSLRCQLIFKSISYRTQIRERYAGVAAPKVWESLPYCITSLNTLASFKKALKDYYIFQYV